MTIKHLVLVMGIVGMGLGCASARVVSKRPGAGGVIAVSSATSSGAREKASELMRENCGSKTAKIVEEGESVIGKETRGSKTASNSAGNTREVKLLGIPGTITSGGATVDSQSTTENKTEWRIHYDCV